MRVLVVDDDGMMRESMSELLRGEGHNVITASHGMQAIELLRKKQVDIMITDIIMPFKEGVETIIECKKIWGDLRVIAISGGGRIASSDFLAVAQKYGADKVMQKPFDPSALIAAVKDLAASNRPDKINAS